MGFLGLVKLRAVSCGYRDQVTYLGLYLAFGAESYLLLGLALALAGQTPWCESVVGRTSVSCEFWSFAQQKQRHGE